MDYLFICGLNGYAAAVKAGYSEKSAYNIASQNVRKLHINKAIQARLSEVHMSADEALALLAQHARGDIGDLSDENGFFDFRKAKENGQTKLIKKFRQKTVTIMGNKEGEPDTEIHTTEVEMHDSQAAIDKVLRVYGKYKDVGTEGNPLVIKPENMTPSEIASRVAAILAQKKNA